MTSRSEALAASWDANARNWTQAVRGGRIESRRAGTDGAILQALLSRRPARLLDAGCGEGWLIRALRDAAPGCACIGIDGAAALVEAARAADPVGDYRRVAYRDLVAGDHGLPGGFDAIVFNFALFGADGETAALLAATRPLLAPGGAIAIQTVHPDTAGPAPGAEGWRVEDFAGFEAGAEGWAPMPWYFRTLEGWRSVLDRAGLALRGLHAPTAEPGGRPLSLLMLCGEP